MLSRGVCTVALTLSGIAWLLFLCGLAAVQAYCSEDHLNVETRAAGYLGPASCSTLFGYSWWILWYQFFLLCGISAAVVLRAHRMQPAILGFLGPVTTLLMDTANTFIYIEDLPLESGTSQIRVVAGGAVFSSIMNLVLIFVIALDEDEEMEGPSPMAPPKHSIPSAVM